MGGKDITGSIDKFDMEINGTDAIDDEEKTVVNGSENTPSIANYVHGSDSLDFHEGTTLHDGDNDAGHKLGDLGSLNKGIPDSHIKQMQYNQNKIIIERCIISTSDLLNEFKDLKFNYPTNQIQFVDTRLNSTNSQAAVTKTNTHKILTSFDLLKISNIQVNDEDVNESLLNQILSTKFDNISEHLLKLNERVIDTTSKVLITGDLNSGKSSFCNSLLRRSIMPVDQQPCTNVFCEIINYQENGDVEEVHAIPIGSDYNIKDETTFNKFPINKLEDLVYENHIYSLLKVYVNDFRSKDKSLLKNGVIDIRLIDAPGLNSDLYKTMQLFSKQQEIDLVIFIVNAENHFTLSGREFLTSSHNDKQFTFVVVNKFDSIKKKDICREKIMSQINELSPETYKDSENFVHFISSKYPEDDDGDDNNNDPDDDSNDAEEPLNPDFDRLESSLRNFILDKRSVSKLLPAKNYLMKIFVEAGILIDYNLKDIREKEAEITSQLNEIKPKYDLLLNKSDKISEKIQAIIDSNVDTVYEKTKKSINETIESLVHLKVDENVTIFNIDQFIQSNKLKFVHDILTCIEDCEDFGRLTTLNCINEIRNQGKKILEDKLVEHKFKPENMYSHKKDYELKNKININFELIDMIDFESIVGFFKHFESLFKFSFNFKKVSDDDELNITKILSNNLFKTGGASMLILYGPKLLNIFNSVSSVIKLPNIITFGLIGVGVGYPIYYMIKESPKTIHYNMMKKMVRNLESDNYIHINSLRISREVNKVLQYPAKDVILGINGLIDFENGKKIDLANRLDVIKVGSSKMRKLKERIEIQKEIVEALKID